MFVTTTLRVEQATRAASLVADDLERTLARRPAIIVSLSADDEICVAVEGGYGETFVHPGALDDAIDTIVAIADHVQSELADGRDSWFVWPLCADHAVAPHAEVHDGRAVWWCRVGRHSLGTVGQLQPTQ